MGYVLPVLHFQYQDYKNRITRDKQNKFYIDSPYKPTLDRAYQDIKANMADYYGDIEGNERYATDQYNKVFSEITGKGRHVNIHV